MAIAQRITEQEFIELVFSDPDRTWELWDGVPREKPGMSMKHDNVSFLLGHLLQSQLSWESHRVNVSGGKARLSARSYFVPDVVVIPAEYQLPFEHDPRAFNAFTEPLPLVVEIWSSSTGDNDRETKLAGYRQRGDTEIWLIHPYDHTLTAWRRQPDGSYQVSSIQGGFVSAESLPGVTIDLDALLDW